MQQKQRSTYVLDMWKIEPFKAKWTVIAKAYSSIRNHIGKDRAPIDDFLHIVCPKMDVIKPEEYFTVMGWTLDYTNDGSTIFKQSTRPNLLGYNNSTFSDKELIIYCAQMNYISPSAAVQITEKDLMLGQQDLFASAPALAESPKPSESSNIAAGEPQAIASQSSGFDFSALPPNTAQQLETYQWTGSMVDLYNPAEGSVDYENLLQENSTSTHSPQL